MDPIEALRMLLILLHLLAFSAAAAATTFGDFTIFALRRIDLALLHRAARLVAGVLAVLLLSGLAVVRLDTGFALDELARRPKLLAKFSLVVLLTLNGWALHRHVFPRRHGPHSRPLATALWATVAGAVSAASWLFAAFVGVGKPVAAVLGYAGFMLLYGLTLGLALVASLWQVHPRLVTRLAHRLSIHPSQGAAD